MPHQCLKCGTLFPDGSTQILRGCPDCRGTRFFFTDEAIPEAERSKLLKEGEADLSAVLRDLSARARDPPTPSPPVPPLGSPPDQQPLVPPRASAKVLPGNKLLIKMRRRRLARKVRHASANRGWDYDSSDALEHELERDPVEIPEPEDEPEPEQAPPAREPARPMAPPAVAPDVERIDAHAPWPGQERTSPPPVQESPPVERVSYGEDGSPKEPEEPAKAPEATVRVEIERRPRRPAGEESASDDGAPETVRIDGPGLYNIDVKRLLEEAPIVVQKDGSYLIHLPSLFEGDAARNRDER